MGAFGRDDLVGIANLAKDDIGRAEIVPLVRSDRKRVDHAIMHWHSGGTHERTESRRNSKRMPVAPSVWPKAALECRPDGHQSIL